MNAGNKIFITGSGALAQAIVGALSLSISPPLEVIIYSRSLESSSWLATIGNIRAQNAGNPVVFIPQNMDWESDHFLYDELNTHQPQLIIHTASLQSMWSLKVDNGWSRLVKSIGYGASLPLQCALAFKMSKAIDLMEDPPKFVNCSYPDVVNHILTKSGNSVMCGIGNIGFIELSLKRFMDRDQKFLMLANHYHVQQMMVHKADRESLPRLFVKGEEVLNTQEFFDNITLRNEPSLNHIIALTCVNFIDVVVQKKDKILHLPGPLGFPGGYPVEFKKGKIETIGTNILSLDEELNWNKKLLEKEGWVIGEQTMNWSDSAYDKICPHSKELAKGFQFENAQEFIEIFKDFKNKMKSVC